MKAFSDEGCDRHQSPQMYIAAVGVCRNTEERGNVDECAPSWLSGVHVHKRPSVLAAR